MARPLDPQTLDLARARMQLSLPDAPARIAARRGLRKLDLSDMSDSSVCLLADPEKRNAVLAAAAAAYHGDEIARAVSPRDRKAISQTVSDEARQFAVAHRGLSKAQIGGEIAFADRLEATRSHLEELLDARLEGVASQPSPLDECLDAALEAHI